VLDETPEIGEQRVQVLAAAERDDGGAAGVRPNGRLGEESDDLAQGFVDLGDRVAALPA
jgi:hypothetical protein